MAINVVENVNGIARVNWVGVSVTIGLGCTCAIIPAIGMWLLFPDTKLAGAAFANGFAIGCGTLPVLVLQRLRLPIEKLPIRQ
jgi:hypothetical protein